MQRWTGRTPSFLHKFLYNHIEFPRSIIDNSPVEATDNDSFDQTILLICITGPFYDRDFPKHYDVSVQRKISSDSRIFLTSECFRWIHPSSPEHIGETRIGAERAKLWNEIVYRRVLLEAMLQPAKRFIFFA